MENTPFGRLRTDIQNTKGGSIWGSTVATNAISAVSRRVRRVKFYSFRAEPNNKPRSLLFPSLEGRVK
jgi:hypothetical protein